MQCASLGAVNYSLLAALYYACQGDSGLKEYESRTSGAKGKRDAAVDEAVSTVKRHMRIFFPSRETVLQSKGGGDVGFPPTRLPWCEPLTNKFYNREPEPSASKPSGGKPQRFPASSCETANPPGQACSCTAR